MSKREARIARQIEEKLKQDEKSARLRQRVMAEPQVRAESQPGAKGPRAGADPGSIFGQRMTWNSDEADVVGAWSWNVDRQWTQEDWQATILPKLQEWAVTGSHISRHKMHHNMEVERICDEAQYRLIELEMYPDVIFRFRLGNRPRLWGFRQLAEFQIIWYDPTHKVYPTDPS